MTRTKDSYQKELYDFIKYDIEVTCPKCSKRALVVTNGFSFQNNSTQVKFSCANCGNSKLLSEKPAAAFTLFMGSSVDPFFELPLWLVTSFADQELWAYNKEHLDFIREHVEAKLRERSGQNIANRSIGSRLPRWMTSKKNREAILKSIDLLRSKK